MVESPCTDECSLDEDGEYCTGCERSIEEVINWNSMTDEQKKEVIERLSQEGIEE